MNRITVTNKSQRLTVTSAPKSRILINNRTGGVGSVDTLRQLKDVDATSLDNNETIVYDGVSGKFVIKELPIINGGEF
jgi:hypothetical protein